MALAMAFDDAKTNQIRHQRERGTGGIDDRDGKGTTGAVLRTRFFGSHDKPDLPYANLTKHDPGTFSSTHFHIVDQFQVIVDGKGTLGRHSLAPYTVHFSRAYTPYGPLVSDPGTGFTFFVLRPRPDPGSQHLPEKQDRLDLVPDRQPWQITRLVTLPALQSGAAAVDVMLQAIPGIKDEKGLAAYTLNMKPNAKTGAPDPSHGDGQYLVVVKGSLLHNDKELKAPALVFVYPKEGPFQIHAGSAGLEALVLNFPSPQTRPTGAAKSVQAATDFRTWQCVQCGFVYDEAAGLPEEGIAPGTRWKDVPETWSCPDCSSSKSGFQMVELKN